MRQIGMPFIASLPPKSEFEGGRFNAITVDAGLKKHGYYLFCYDPDKINPQTNTVAGYIIENERFKPTIETVPKLNYESPLRLGLTRHGNALASFKGQTQKYFFYPRQRIGNLAADKLATSQIISEYNSHIVPETRQYNSSWECLTPFFEQDKRVFLKPRYGNCGNGIIVAYQHQDSYQLNWYNKRKKNTLQNLTAPEALAAINDLSKDTSYIVQQAINVHEINDTIYDLRVVLYYINDKWHTIRTVRRGAKGKDVSNTSQGGTFEMDEHLYVLFSSEDVDILLEKVHKAAMGIAHHLNKHYNNAVDELVIDFVIDQQLNPFVAEINTKPAILGDPRDYKDFYNRTPQEEKRYQTLSLKHGELIAKLLISKMQHKPLWFQHIISTVSFNEQTLKYLSQTLFMALSQDNKSLEAPDAISLDVMPRIVFLSVSWLKQGIKIYTGKGNGLYPALCQALTRALSQKQTDTVLAIKLDIVDKVTMVPNFALPATIKNARGTYGIAFDEYYLLAYLPDEILTKTIINSNNQIVLKNLALSAQLKEHLRQLPQFPLYFYSTQSFTCTSERCCTLYRGHPMFDSITPDLLLHSATLAGDYLTRMVDDKGRFLYEYFPKQDTYSDKYNILRHAGSIYAMLELYPITQNQSLLNAAQQALRFLFEQAKPVDDNTLCIVEDDYAKLGANALTLLAFAEYVTITQDKDLMPQALKLAEWIKHTQKPSGEFVIFKQHYSTQTITDFVSQYYPGEAIYALVKFYEITNDETWLDMAQQGADYIIHTRDKNKTVQDLEHDHWLLYGLNALDTHRSSPDYLLQTKRICQAIITAQHQNVLPKDHVGGFYNPPRSTPTAVRAEGLAAAYKLLIRHQDKTTASEVLTALHGCIRFQLQTQFPLERCFGLRNPARALGGFSKSLTDYSIRIDYVQHNLSAILALYQILTSSSNEKINEANLSATTP